MPLVSVLMPMRNVERYVEAAVRSVLAQESVELELIVIDDGSTDKSEAVVRGFDDRRIRLIRGPRQGIAAALNTGLEVARGCVVSECDADDLYPPDRMSWQSEWLAEHPGFAAVCAPFSTMSQDGRLVRHLDCGSVPEEVTGELRGGVLRTSFCTFGTRTEVLRQLAGFRTYFVMAEDFDLMLRMGDAHRVWYEPRANYFYRLHDSSITHSQRIALRDFYEATARQFSAQRQATGIDDLHRGCPPEPTCDRASKPHKAAAHIQGMLTGRAWREHGAGQKCRALLTGARACLARPTRLGTWRNLFLLLVKPCGRDRANRT
jgi:glycosyltransferase involved in cell wall biosynthesis